MFGGMVNWSSGLPLGSVVSSMYSFEPGSFEPPGGKAGTMVLVVWAGGATRGVNYM